MAVYAIEGLDYTGKTTLLTTMVERFPEAYINEYPDYTTESGKIIRGYLDKEVELAESFVDALYEKNRGETSDLITESEISILGRYTISGAVYRLAADTKLEGLDDDAYVAYVRDITTQQFERELNTYKTPLPTTIIYLDATVDEINQWFEESGRPRATDLREEDGFQRRVARIYDIVFDLCTEMGIEVARVKLTSMKDGKPQRISSTTLARKVTEIISYNN